MLDPRRSLLAAAAAAPLLAGCAHLPPPPGASGRPGAESSPAAVVTGSRLPQRVDPVTGKAVPVAAVRTYSRADLDRTGRPGLAGALPAALASQP
jgi:hypothetical protein